MDDGEMHRRIVGYGVRVLGVSFRTEAPDSPVLRSLDNDGFFARKLRDTARPVLHVCPRPQESRRDLGSRRAREHRRFS